MTCFTDLGVFFGIGILWNRRAAQLRQTRRRRRRLLQQLAQKILGKELVRGAWHGMHGHHTPGGRGVGDEGVLGAVRRYLATRGADFAPPSLGECCAVTPGLASAHAATQGLTSLVDNMPGSLVGHRETFPQPIGLSESLARARCLRHASPCLFGPGQRHSHQLRELVG